MDPSDILSDSLPATCPACHSGYVARTALVYQQHTYLIPPSQGVPARGGHHHVMRHAASPPHSTALLMTQWGRSLAPPKRSSGSSPSAAVQILFRSLIGGGLGWGVGLGASLIWALIFPAEAFDRLLPLLGSLTGAVVYGFFFFPDAPAHASDADDQQALTRWQQEWCCLSCGHRWVPKPHDAP